MEFHKFGAFATTCTNKQIGACATSIVSIFVETKIRFFYFRLSLLGIWIIWGIDCNCTLGWFCDKRYWRRTFCVISPVAVKFGGSSHRCSLINANVLRPALSSYRRVLWNLSRTFGYVSPSRSPSINGLIVLNKPKSLYCFSKRLLLKYVNSSFRVFRPTSIDTSFRPTSCLPQHYWCSREHDWPIRLIRLNAIFRY